MKNIKDVLNLKGKKVLLRLDLNVPLNNGKIIDATRIDKILPTLNFLLNQNSKIIILSHIGRPKGKIVKELSLKPISEDLRYKLKKDVKFVKKNITELNNKDLFTNPDEKIVMLENIRFYEQEEKNDEKFAKVLSKLADIYVNDAFSCSHREHTSVTKITNFLPSYCGLQMNSEINALKKITSSIERPVTCIIGGSKILTKINIIKNLVTKFDHIIIVGGMANNIIKYNGYNIGKSLIEESSEPIIKEILSLAEEHNCKITYPKDVSVGKNLKDIAKTKKLSDLDSSDLILDIGPETIEVIKSIIHTSKTILWNGPAGYFENLNFAKGSIEIAEKITSMKDDIYSVAGGGDTIAILNQTKVVEQFNFISTAGGAFLEYLEGKEIPGIKALN